MAQQVFLGFKQLFERYGAGRTERAFRLALYRAIRAGTFPAPLCIGTHSRAWRADALETWERSLATVSYAAPRLVSLGAPA